MSELQLFDGAAITVPACYIAGAADWGIYQSPGAFERMQREICRRTVAFRWKDYRIKTGDLQRVMRLATDEFIRRFLIHVLPDGFHRIRHYGVLAGATRKATIARIRTLLGEASPAQDRNPQTSDAEIVPLTLREPCPCCGGPMRIVEIFRRGQRPRSRAPPRDQAA
jgi:hypothetical protein